MKNKDYERLVIDDDGVVVDVLQFGDRIIRASSIETFKAKKERENDYKLYTKSFINYDEYVSVNIIELVFLLSELGHSERAFILTLIPHIRYETCLIGHRNGKPITIKDMEKITGKSRSTIVKTIEKLVNKKILYKERKSHEVRYFFNPFLVKKGNYINKEVKAMFGDYYIRSLRRYVKEN